MSMKLSRRDRIIFLCGIVLIVGIVGFLALLKPKYADVQAANDRLAAKQAEEAEVQAKIDTLESLKKRLEDDVKSVSEYQKQFISEKDIFQTQQISTYLMDLLEPSGVEIVSMSVPTLAPGTLAAYTYNKNALAYEMRMNADIAHQLPEEVYYAYNQNYPVPPPAVQIGRSTVTVSYRCEDPMSIFDAIELIAENDKDVYLTTVSSETAVEADSEGGVSAYVEGTITVEVYTINPLDPEDIDKEVTLTSAE